MSLRYNRLIATGGIGTGILFAVSGTEPLGRTESRDAILTSVKDYCKAHIITHYAATCLAPALRVQIIGAVGHDESGRQLLADMEKTGIDTSKVLMAERPTMYSVCIQYEDGAVCNVTSSNSACELVTDERIRSALADNPPDAQTILLGVPEVPLTARIALLESGSESLRISSFTESEAKSFRNLGGLGVTDLLIVNEGEAQALLGTEKTGEALFDSTLAALRHENSNGTLVVTCGEKGAYGLLTGQREYIPAENVSVHATGGAGDALCAGVICGLALGRAADALAIGAHFAALSVQCEDTICRTIGTKDIESVRETTGSGRTGKN